jgi:2-phospho-L-lactate transferase/gluconeogenesis factor (CofD/UPF0052 family)/glycosyltransferase involved in cell wall biosynthesis
MNNQTTKLKVVMFSGGRGTGSISEALLKYPDVELTLLVNAYDDGLSTGLLRKFISGMLGPSDIRKNISRFVKHKNYPASQALHHLIEYRFPKQIETDEAVSILRSFINLDDKRNDHEVLKEKESLSLFQIRTAGSYLENFLRYYEKNIKEKPWFNFKDVSLGNLLFGGCYLVNNNNFNQAITDFSKFAEIGNHVINITKGENRVLVAIKQDGQYLNDEASIVSPQDSSRIQELFLLSDYLNINKYPIGKYKADNIRLLRNLESLPEINPQAEKILREADVIVYGPGTQYSSLLPSYLTSGVAEAIQANATAEKVFIANIARDYDILGEDATTLVRAFLLNMCRKVEGSFECQDLITHFFFQKPEAKNVGETPYVNFNIKDFKYPLEKVNWIDWEGERGKHSGSRTVSELMLIIENQLQKRISHISQKVSIIVPALNEESTIKKVLQDLSQLQFLSLELDKEIIVIDGGSTDKTYKIASQDSSIRTYLLGKNSGRGKALRLGLEKAKGDIIVFFPSDGEYFAEDIIRIVSPLVNQEFPVVFGSRAFRTGDLNGRLEQIYGNKGVRYIISKYGGAMLSIMTLLLYQRFISDPFTSIKGLNARILRNMHFIKNGVDFDMELIAKIIQAGHMILEVPINYKARTIKEGKKMTIKDGLQCLWTLIRFSFLRHKSKSNFYKNTYAESINSHSSIQ